MIITVFLFSLLLEAIHNALFFFFHSFFSFPLSVCVWLDLFRFNSQIERTSACVCSFQVLSFALFARVPEERKSGAACVHLGFQFSSFFFFFFFSFFFLKKKPITTSKRDRADRHSDSSLPGPFNHPFAWVNHQRTVDHITQSQSIHRLGF